MIYLYIYIRYIYIYIEHRDLYELHYTLASLFEQDAVTVVETNCWKRILRYFNVQPLSDSEMF